MREKTRKRRTEAQRKVSERRKPIYQKLSKYQKRLKQNPTPAEKYFKKSLDKHKIKFKFQKYFLCDNFQCIIDFFISTGLVNICVEIDGGYHFTELQQRKDEYRSKWLREKRKCRIIRFTNDEVFEDVDKCVYELSKFFLSNCHLQQAKNHIIFTSVKDNYESTATIGSDAVFT